MSFDDDETMPHCECADWQRHRLPCMHFLSVFRNFKGWGFDKFPAQYRESPFLTLDHDVVFSKEPLANIDDKDVEDGAIPEQTLKVHT